MKRIAVLLLSLAMLLSLAACGSKGGETASPSSPAAPSESPGQETKEPAEPEGWKPASTVNVIVGFAAGGGMDSLARAVAQYIDLDGQSMYVTNIEGGGGNIGGMEAYHSDNDGYTLYFGSPQANACNYLSGGLSENLNEEMVYICCMAEDVNVLTVGAGSPYQTFEDVVAAAQANPKGISIASVGSGNSMEASAADVWLQAGVEFTYVPYDSASKSRTAVLGGHSDLLWSQLAEAKSYIDSGELRILAVAADERVSFYPDCPTFKELGVDTASAISRSVMLPPGADEAVARYYDEKLHEVFENPDFQAVVQDTLGYVLIYTDYDGMKDKTASLGQWAEKMMPMVLN
nr:tripartite tricarboxylate transporter substrate binding protein [uncultured Oscillibacter sp.]